CLNWKGVSSWVGGWLKGWESRLVRFGWSAPQLESPTPVRFARLCLAGWIAPNTGAAR
ncbi:MAG: hypothetical protein ACI89X_004973, partial [Planctomycetota bacterium]